MPIFCTSRDYRIPHCNILLRNLVENVASIIEFPQLPTSGQQRGPRVYIWVLDFTENPFHGNQVFRFCIEGKKRVSNMRVGFEISTDGMGMELVSGCHVAEVGAGSEGAGECVVVWF
ncbi:hypothetical protein L1049_012329 [Liquidambar formosana]|uniref:Uncharacterized protein n=1 Tax=Liquidambar formosana TaxID=63359 RepID=A0AAP0RU40_LIQFO